MKKKLQNKSIHRCSSWPTALFNTINYEMTDCVYYWLTSEITGSLYLKFLNNQIVLIRFTFYLCKVAKLLNHGEWNIVFVSEFILSVKCNPWITFKALQTSFQVFPCVTQTLKSHYIHLAQKSWRRKMFTFKYEFDTRNTLLEPKKTEGTDQNKTKSFTFQK